MGLLSQGTPLDWEDVVPHADTIRDNGIQQLLSTYHKLKTRRQDVLLWGDEVSLIDNWLNIAASLSLDANETLERLQNIEENSDCKSSWHPEYARYMLEGTPKLPYGHTLEDFLCVEDNMIRRRALASSLLPQGQAVMTLTAFPMLGQPDFSTPYEDPTPFFGYSQSMFLNDNVIGLHPRFKTLTRNIRKRRKSKVAINVPIFKDKNTPSPFLEPLPLYLQRILELEGKSFDSVPEYESAALPDHIYMDAMAFGMGNSCLQVTFQACTIEQARRLYDQLAVMTPIMMALSASSPIYRGYLADVDCRWDIIAASVDDRTKQERGEEPGESRFRMHKSRYDSISRYLSTGPNVSGGCSGVPFSRDPPGSEFYKEEYNDLEYSFDPKIYQTLVDGGVDDLLAKHYAHLFIRDPLVIYNELLSQDNSNSMDHFENIQSTNWQTMRFKPPPAGSNIGWRVEFRSMDLQLTDHENAAFAIFVVLLARTITHFDLDLYMPLSKVDINMKRGQKRDAVGSEKFWFRDFSSGAFTEQTLDQIMNGKNGIVGLVDRYIDETDMSNVTRLKLKRYTNVIRQKANGERITGATWIRNFCRSHQDYQFDSVITHKINHDLCQKILELMHDDFLKTK